MKTKAYRFESREELDKLVEKFGTEYFSIIPKYGKSGYLFTDDSGCWTSADDLSDEPDKYKVTFKDAMKEGNMTIEEQIKLAKSYIGKACVSEAGTNITPKSVKVYVDEEEVKKSSGFVKTEFAKRGIVVAVSDGFYVTPVSKIIPPPKYTEVVLNMDYTAQVYKKYVQVGCQKISRQAIEEVYAAMNKQ